MSTNTPDQPELSCQWCGGTIPAGLTACDDCGALRPRDDLVVPGLSPSGQTLRVTSAVAEPESNEDDDAERARQILKDMDAYIPESTPPSPRVRRDPGDDLIVVLVVMGAGGLAGGLTGWLLLPPLLHQFFETVVGVDSDGPEAFRRLGAFVGALVMMLFGALLATIIRR